MTEMTHTPRTHISDYLLATGAALFLAFVFVHALLPWWASALMLAAAAIASLEAVALARGECDE